MNANKRRWNKDGARFDYDAGADVLYVHREGAPSSNHSEMRENGFILDFYDEKLVGMTVLEASQRLTLEYVDWESLVLSVSPRFREIIEQVRQRREAEGGISLEEMRRRLDM